MSNTTPGRNKVKRLKKTEDRGMDLQLDRQKVQADWKKAEETEPVWKSRGQKRIAFFFSSKEKKVK